MSTERGAKLHSSLCDESISVKLRTNYMLEVGDENEVDQSALFTQFYTHTAEDLTVTQGPTVRKTVKPLCGSL